MALTKQFTETVQARVRNDAAFGAALLKEALESLLQADLATGKALLRDYVNAAIGFEDLARQLEIPAKSLHRMLGPGGNPTADNLFRVLASLQRAARVQVRVQLGAAAAEGVRETPPAYGAGRAGKRSETPADWARRWARRRRRGLAAARAKVASERDAIEAATYASPLERAFARLRVTPGELEAFCRERGIVKLSLFGSVMRDDFRPGSDVDVIAQFDPDRGRTAFDLVDLQIALKKFFRRKVDVFTSANFPNPIRRESVQRDLTVAYARGEA